MDENETLGIEEVATLLRAESETVMLYARRGELPGARIGKSWVFLRDDVLSFLRDQIAADTDARRKAKLKPPPALAVALPRSRRRPIVPLPGLPEPVTASSPKPRG